MSEGCAYFRSRAIGFIDPALRSASSMLWSVILTSGHSVQRGHGLNNEAMRLHSAEASASRLPMVMMSPRSLRVAVPPELSIAGI
jgi:hypothetical protein